MKWWQTLALAVLIAGPATAQQQPKGKVAQTPDEPFLKTSVTFVFGDDNLLVGAGETRKSSPSAYFGNCHGTIADRTEPSECGKNVTRLLLYKRLLLSPFFQPEAALSIDLDVDNNRLSDSGSYIRTNFFLDTRHERYWAFTLFPVDSDRMRLGFHPDVSWGGTDSFPKNFRSGLAPGLQFDLDYRYSHFFLGFKAARVKSPAEDTLINPGGNELKNVQRTFYGVLGGAGFEVQDSGLRFEFNGGFFNKGTNTRMNALGQSILAGGASGRVSFRRGIPIGRAMDVRIFQQDKIREELFRREQYRTGALSLAIEGEFWFLAQVLEDPDNVSSTKSETAIMGHIGAKMKYGYFRLHMDVIYRDLTAILFDVPGFIPYQALSADVKVSPEVYGAIAADYNIQPYDLTLGLTLGVLQPATYAGIAPTGANASSVDQGNTKVVVRGDQAGDWDILPNGQDELPLFVGRVDLKWSYYDAFRFIATLWYGRDDNLASIKPDASGHNLRTFEEPNALGFTILSQVNF